MYPEWLSVPAPSPSRPLSATGELRASQRVEALRELRVLTEQMLDLPERLRQAGLARRQSQQLQDALEAYTELATLAWQGIAEDRFDEVVGQSLYRQRAVAATKRVNRLQQIVTDPDGTPAKALTIPVKPVAAAKQSTGVPLFWAARNRRAQEALEQMRAALTLGELTLPEPAAFGNAVEALRGAAGYGSLHPLMLAVLRVVTVIALVAGGLVTILMIAAAASALTLGQTALGETFIVGAVALLFTYGAVAMALASNRPALVDYISLARWRLYSRESSVGLGLLTGWNWFASLAGLLVAFGAIGIAGWLLATAPNLANVTNLAHALQFLSGTPLLILLGAAAITLLAPVVVALPATLSYQVMLARDMAARINWSPAARRGKLNPALKLLAWHLIIALPLALSLATLIPATQQPLYAIAGFALTGRSAIFAGVVIILYLAAIGLPLRNGIARWRLIRLMEARQRLEIVADKIRQLMPIPEAIEDIAPVQLELDWVNYLRTQERDLRKVRRAVASFGARLVALMIILVAAVLTDVGLAWAARLWLGH